MAYSSAVAALRHYHEVKRRSDIEGASPHRLIQVLFESALERLARARGHILRSEVGAKGEQLGRAISIVASLRESLDTGQGGALAANLALLYDYMERRLLQANLESSCEMVDEVSSLLRQIKEGWDNIAPESS